MPAALQVVTVTEGAVQAGAAIPVYVADSSERVEGGSIQPVYVVSDGPVRAQAAIPVVIGTYGMVSSGPAMRVYVVSGSLNPEDPYSPSLDFSDGRNSMYVGLL